MRGGLVWGVVVGCVGGLGVEGRTRLTRMGPAARGVVDVDGVGWCFL